MAKTRFIKFRVTSAQYDRIINSAQYRGYTKLSEYLRFLALDKGAVVEQKILENNRILLRIIKILEEKTNQDN